MLAKKIGVTRNAVIAWEKETSRMSEENEKKAREIFGAELDTEPVDVSFESKSESAGDLEELVRKLASVKPDIVLQFRRVVRNIEKLSEQDARFLAHIISLCLGQVYVKISAEEV